MLTLSHSYNEQGYQYGGLFFGKTRHTDGLIALSTRIKGSPQLSDGSIPYNKEDIHSLLAKGNWTITPSYMISAQLRYYQNDGIQLKKLEIVGPNYYKNSRYERDTNQYDIQLSQKIYPLHSINWFIDWDLYYSKLIIKQKPVASSEDERHSLISQGSKITNHFIWNNNPFATHQLNFAGEFYQQ